jgi:hypothetical protein
MRHVSRSFAVAAFVVVVSSVLSLRCGVNDAPAGPGSIYTFTAHDSAEARAAAVWSSGELEAPAAEMAEHLFNYKNIRTLYADSAQIDTMLKYDVRTEFRPPWVIGEVLAKFDSASSAQIRAGTYAGWSHLPLWMRPDTIPTLPDEIGWGLFRYRTSYHPRRLAELYLGLPGNLSAHPNYYFYADSWFNAIPVRLSEGWGYYFVRDAYPGSWSNRYFRVVGGKPSYVGRWKSGDPTPPAWYAEVESTMTHFAEWDGWQTNPVETNHPGDTP